MNWTCFKIYFQLFRYQHLKTGFYSITYCTKRWINCITTNQFWANWQEKWHFSYREIIRSLLIDASNIWEVECFSRNHIRRTAGSSRNLVFWTYRLKWKFFVHSLARDADAVINVYEKSCIYFCFSSIYYSIQISQRRFIYIITNNILFS